MKKQLILTAAIAAVVAGGAGFGGGYALAKRGVQPASAGNYGNIQNLSPQERQARMQQFGGGAGGARGARGGATGGMTTGDIISKDDKSVTLKLGNGGSAIVFFSDSTKITTTTAGSLSDLTTGARVLVSGDKNADGSITAKTLQIVPADAGNQQPPAAPAAGQAK